MWKAAGGANRQWRLCRGRSNSSAQTVGRWLDVWNEPWLGNYGGFSPISRRGFRATRPTSLANTTEAVTLITGAILRWAFQFQSGGDSLQRSLTLIRNFVYEICGCSLNWTQKPSSMKPSPIVRERVW